MRCLFVVVLAALVTISLAKKDCGENEEYACKLNCDKRCENLDSLCLDIGNNCKCFCVKGYARDSHGVCVPEDQCGAESTTESSATSSTSGNTESDSNTEVGDTSTLKPGFPEGIFGDAA
uniref:Putative inducible metalloproteinase inhibitor protein n=1 Tax=Xenopsylla cheopis TaxID=163159 RepID=A0A6M2DVW4_XENCH